MGHGLWIKKHVSCGAIVYVIVVSSGTVLAQDSIKVAKVPQATAVSPAAAVPLQATAVPQTTATPPAITQPSVASIAEIEDQARMDAHTDIKGQTWFFIGCLTNLTGWLIAYIVEPSPPVSRLLGKSGDYIAVYTDTYKREGKKIQAQKAFAGCVVGVLSVVALELLLVLIMANTMPSSSATY